MGDEAIELLLVDPLINVEHAAGVGAPAPTLHAAVDARRALLRGGLLLDTDARQPAHDRRPEGPAEAEALGPEDEVGGGLGDDLVLVAGWPQVPLQPRL